MNRVVAALLRIVRRPGQVLLVLAAVPVAIFAFVALLVGIAGGGWVLLVVAAVLGLPLVVLSWRRHRLQRWAESEDEQPVVEVIDGESGSRVVIVQGDTPGDRRVISFTDLPRTRFMPGVAIVQRIMLDAAGGPVNAPYLKDDLRITILAAIGAVVAVPLSILGAFIAVFALLL